MIFLIPLVVVAILLWFRYVSKGRFE